MLFCFVRLEVAGLYASAIAAQLFKWIRISGNVVYWWSIFQNSFRIHDSFLSHAKITTYRLRRRKIDNGFSLSMLVYRWTVDEDCIICFWFSIIFLTVPVRVDGNYYRLLYHWTTSGLQYTVVCLSGEVINKMLRDMQVTYSCCVYFSR